MKGRKDKRPDHTQDDRKRNDALNKSANRQEDKKLPGDYPPKEDIMNRMNNMRRVGMDVENFSRSIGAGTFKIIESVGSRPRNIDRSPDLPPEDVEDRHDHIAMEHPIPKNVDEDNDRDPSEKSDSDVTQEDMEALGPKDLSMDMGEDERILKGRVWPVDMAGSDLDVPGAELDDENEAIGSEDEENNPYSLGGDSHEDNMEGK